jgi:hypothetical protein
MAKKKVSKGTQNKLTQAAATLQNFSSSSVVASDIILNSIYLVNGSDDPVTLTIMFNNIAVAASTNLFLNSNPILPPKIVGSLQNKLIETNKNASGNFLNIFSGILVTNLTPVPDKLKVDISLSGGASAVSYPLPEFDLKAIGDKVNLSISIFFMHI